MKTHPSFSTAVSVLFVDDDLFLGQVVVTALKEAGYEVYYQSSLAGIRAVAQEIQPDIIFLDVEMGNDNSIGLASQLKALLPAVPLFFVSSHTDGQTIDRGLLAGADGYLKKPFEVTEILAYVKRYAANTKQHIIRIGALSLDPNTYMLMCGNQVIKQLSDMEYHLLKYLAAYPNQLVTKSDLERELWGEVSSPSIFSLNNYVSKVRKYLAADSNIKLQVLPRRGYRLIIPPT
ncbi:MAG: response regulator transcription factor [Prevotellaceae bacterium]|jgi:two-component system KDP operon response regulator KdpE|nr:response regulator transcription factor [Prevotellaceae bacterium]